MPPPGHQPFLRAICDNPEDDTVRLVYADWLDENGDPERAEFIRVSIEWSRAEYPSVRSNALRDRVVAFVKRHGEQWLSEFPKSPGLSWDIGFPWGPFSRGFPATTVVLNRRFPEVAEQVFTLAPIEHLVFPRVSLEVIHDTLACPCIGGILGFTIVWSGPNQPGDALCEVLAGLTHLRRLESLSLGEWAISDRGAVALARANFLPQLRHLLLQWNPMSETGVLAVADRLSPKRIQNLSLPAERVSAQVQERLQQRFGAALRWL